MKKTVGLFFILIALSLCFTNAWSQKKTTLELYWSRADALMTVSKSPRAALSVLDTIAAIAGKEGQKDALIKVAVYRLALQQTIQDEDPGSNMPFVDSLITAARPPVEKSLLSVLKARMLIAIYNRDRFKISARTAVQGGVPDEDRIAYWTTADFQYKIHDLYSKALAPATELQHTPNKAYSAIINKGNASALRPTLYDLVMHEAIDYYRSGLAAATPSEQGYRLEDLRSLAPAADFARASFAPPPAGDSLNGTWIQLGYYQALTAFHLKDKDLSALADLDLERLDWAHDALSEEDPGKYKQQYRAALQGAVAQYGQTEAALYGAFQLAGSYADDAENYEADGDTAHRYDFVTALHIIDQYQPRLDQEIKAAAATENKRQLSPGAAGLLNLKTRILAPGFNLEMEAVNLPAAPIRALLKFSNVSRLYFRVLRQPVTLENLDMTDSLWKVLVKTAALKSFDQSLPVSGDHQQHAAEIKVPALDKGRYLLLASNNAAFPLDSSLVAVGFSVSGLAYVSQGTDLFFVDRKTGQPASGVDAQFYERVWNHNHYTYRLNTSKRSDSHGRVALDKKMNGSYSLMGIYNGDSLTAPAAYYQVYQYRQNDKDSEGEKNMLFYLDRSIYRPGQQVHFKGIATVLYQDARGRKLFNDGKAHKVYLFDANNQKVDSLSLKLNDFAALSGTFTLPEGRLSGQYSLGTETFPGRQYFQVEQYKRPTYFISFDTLKAPLALGDSVRLQGQAMAYSGYPVTGAKVEIVVTRNIYFPYSWYRYIPQVSATPIAHGTVLTDDKGRFEFVFKAAQGEKSWNRFMPNYHYTVAATTTDQSGETRSGNTSVVIGSQPFNLAVNIPEDTPGDLLDTINVVSTTASGVFTPQTVTLRITQLQAPQRLLRERLWSAPDLAVIDSAAFVRDFPNDPYMDEANKDSWKRGTVVYNNEVTTNKTGKIGLNKKIGPGWYEVACEAAGIGGQTIKDRKYVYVYSPKEPLATPDYNWSESGKTEVLAGQRSGITLASSVQGQPVIYATTTMPGNKQRVHYDYITLRDKPVLLPLTLSRDDIHGAALSYVFVRDNRQYTGSLSLTLKDTTTRPEIIYESFRDKTEPGSKERWTLHINKGKERLKDMELLSAMYDASLDQFTPHGWTLPNMDMRGGVYPSGWQNGQGFGVADSRSKSIPGKNYTSVKAYDRFIYDQFDLFPGRVIRPGIGDKVRIRGINVSDMLAGRAAGVSVHSPSAPLNEVAVVAYAAQSAKKEDLTPEVTTVADKPEGGPLSQPARSDFRETAFFFPEVHSDDQGNYTISFEMPDALTSWNWMNLAYDKALHMATSRQKIISQKSLMVVPNLPRFVRNGDQWTLVAKLVNLTGEPINSKVHLKVEDVLTGRELHWIAGTDKENKDVTVAANSTATVRFDILQPEDFTGPVNVTIQANGGQYSDAEKDLLPVLTNKMQVTETLPVYLKGDGEKSFTLDKLLSLSGKEKQSKQLVLELTTNPIWNVVTALPDISIGEKPSGMDVLSKLYADVMGAYVMRSYPAVQKVIGQWAHDTAATGNKDALLSQLDKNPDLKSVLLEQTPWVMDANSETASRKALVRFFNPRKLDSSQHALAERLLSLQEDNGGFSWFAGGRTDITATQNILTGIHQLLQGKLKDVALEIPLSKIAADAGQYLSDYYTAQYEQWLKRQKQVHAQLGKEGKPDTLYPIGAMEIQYLYALSLESKTVKLNPMQAFFLEQERSHWQSRSVYLQLMIAATQYRMGDKDFAVNTLMTSLLDRTVRSEALGMYWKKDTRYYSWYENPLQAQALAISLITEICKSGTHPEWVSYSAEMQRYLIGQKQVNHWPATRTTVDACVAMIDAAPKQLISDRTIDVRLGSQQLDLRKQAGTGYMRYVVNAEDIKPSMGKVTVSVKGAGNNTAVPVYGALYWQYISAMDAVEAADPAPGITLGKALFREVNGNNGKQLVAVKATDVLHVGDKLVSRLSIRLDRDMDYVHLREMRAAGVQPDQTISGYQFKDGLSYYQTTGDLATDLYFDHIAKGTYVIEYPVHVSHGGSFEAGTAVMESFYAPEFATHTEGIRIQVEQ